MLTLSLPFTRDVIRGTAIDSEKRLECLSKELSRSTEGGNRQAAGIMTVMGT